MFSVVFCYRSSCKTPPEWSLDYHRVASVQCSSRQQQFHSYSVEQVETVSVKGIAMVLTVEYMYGQSAATARNECKTDDGVDYQGGQNLVLVSDGRSSTYNTLLDFLITNAWISQPLVSKTSPHSLFSCLSLSSFSVVAFF